MAVAKTLSADQEATLRKLRNLDDRFSSQGACLYSAPIPMPQIPNSDFLFGQPPMTTGKRKSPPAHDASALK